LHLIAEFPPFCRRLLAKQIRKFCAGPEASLLENFAENIQKHPVTNIVYDVHENVKGMKKNKEGALSQRPLPDREQRERD